MWLPHSYQVTDAQPIDAVPERRALGLPEDAFVFACFNHVYKIDPVVLARWMRILERVPDSVLWLYSEHPKARANLRAEAEKRNVDPSRIVFSGTLAKPQHLARLARADRRGRIPPASDPPDSRPRVASGPDRLPGVRRPSGHAPGSIRRRRAHGRRRRH